MLGGVRERFDHDEVRGRLDRYRELRAAVEVELDWHGGATGHGRERGLETAIGEDAGMDAASELAELLECGIELCARDGQLVRSRAVRFQARLETSEAERKRDEPLLGAIVEVAFDASPRRVRSLDDPRSRGGQLLTGID